ncbi:hypothetical protein SHLI107390_16900 [Shewanella livingstonensis]|uniref:hypothetical protein n=1 Tax=Shewanella livingstonensis TaxID=150120 RepID=UPI0026C3FBDA
MEIEGVISSLRSTDRYVETIFLEGGCYQFHQFLAALFPEAKAVINVGRDHVVTLLNDTCYVCVRASTSSTALIEPLS